MVALCSRSYVLQKNISSKGIQNILQIIYITNSSSLTYQISLELRMYMFNGMPLQNKLSSSQYYFYLLPRQISQCIQSIKNLFKTILKTTYEMWVRFRGGRCFTPALQMVYYLYNYVSLMQEIQRQISECVLTNKNLFVTLLDLVASKDSDIRVYYQLLEDTV
eukprot:TRINITY_DN6981_c0_g1_i1.p2 TRINITY_DN6981_c0_g1~~TRINITY_DN6981_c0_g1_i1.p2  ORF type:complete len:163 (-),score=0.81 TRINITY_DN6981_c0_g1_i1:527-1015(-)